MADLNMILCLLLLFKTGNGSQAIPVRRGNYLIGHASICDPRLRNPSVSRLYACLRSAKGLRFIQDQRSVSGTCVNVQRIISTRLYNNDRIQIGGLLFRFT